MRILNNTYSKEIIFFFTLFLIPSCVFVQQVLALYIYGVDVPYMDDWRSLIAGDAGSFSLQYLLKGANDTISMTGHLLDSLSINFIAGHNVLSQTISLIGISGGLFYLQFKLLRYFSENKLILGLSTLSISFMLQPGSYWGLQTVAYCQAVPLLSILGILYLIVKRPFKNYMPAGVTAFIISLIGGLSYISGAIALSGIACWMLVLSFLAPVSVNRSYRFCGVGILLGSIITLPLQLRVILIQQSGRTHHADASWAFPSDVDFWLYMMGKIARAIGYYDHSSSLLGLTLTILVYLLSLFFMAYIAYASIGLKEKNSGKNWDLLCVYGSLFLAITLYLFMVSAGRTNLRPESVSSTLQIFSFGQLRFHFFWFTILLPWLALLFGIFITSIFEPTRSKIIISSVIFFLTLYIFTSTNIFNHFDHFKEKNRLKTKGLICLKTKTLNKEDIVCPDLIPADLTNAINLAKKLKLSFTTHLNHKAIEPKLLWKQNLSTKNEIQVINAKLSTEKENSESINLIASTDSQIRLDFHDSKIKDELLSCIKLKLNLDIDTNHKDHTQIFYKPDLAYRFSGLDSVRKEYSLNGPLPAQLEFELLSLSGFKPELRIDPGDHPGKYQISNIRVYCEMYRLESSHP